MSDFALVWTHGDTTVFDSRVQDMLANAKEVLKKWEDETYTFWRLKCRARVELWNIYTENYHSLRVTMEHAVNHHTVVRFIDEMEYTSSFLKNVLDEMLVTIKEKISKYQYYDLIDTLRYNWGSLPTRKDYDRMYLGKWDRNTPKFTRIIKAKKGDRIVTIVFWDDGTKTKIVLHNGDPDCTYNAVAIALMIKRHGSNSAFKAHIKKMVMDSETCYTVIARYEAGKMYGSSKNFMKAVGDCLELGKGYEKSRMYIGEPSTRKGGQR